MKKLLTILFLFACSFAYAQSLPNVAFPTSEAVADTYTVNITNYGSSYNDKVALINFRSANSGPATLNITPSGGSALGARPLRKYNGTDWVPLASGDLRGDSSLYFVHYSANCTCLRIVPQGTGSGGATPDLDAVLTEGSTATIASALSVTTNNGVNIQHGDGTVSASVIMTAVESVFEWDNGTNYGNLTMQASGNQFNGSETFVFTPTATESGVNVGSLAGDPSSPENGDLWYDQTANELTARINGANVALGAGGGGTTTNAVTFNNGGSGAASGTTFDGSVARTISYNTVGAQPLDSDLTSWAAITRASGFDTWVATPSSANLAATVTDEVGTGFLPFTRPVINTQVASYVLVASDEWKEVQINAAGANNLELPPDAATPIGFQCVYRRTGAGQTTFTLGSGVTADFSAVVAVDPGQNNLTHIFKDASNHYKVTNGSPGTTAALTASNAYMTTTIGGSPGNALNATASVGVKFTGVTSVATGDLVQVTAADTWSVLAAVSAGSYLRSGGVSTASVWSTLKLPNTATANRVAYATSTNTIGEDADLTFNGTNLNTTTLTVGAGSTISGYISNTAALDFPSTAAGTCEALTITLTGAAVGDAVILGVDNASIPGVNYIYPTAWVSATNTVTVKGCNIQTVSALDPASGTFKVAIFK
jgi:hypothetical protein